MTSSPWREPDRSENLNAPALVEPSSSLPHLPSRPRSTASRTSSFRCSAAPRTLLGAHASGPSRHWRPAQHKPRPSCPAGPRAPRHPAPSSRAARCSAREPSSLALGSSLLLICCFARVYSSRGRRCSSSCTSLILMLFTLSKGLGGAAARWQAAAASGRRQAAVAAGGRAVVTTTALPVRSPAGARARGREPPRLRPHAAGSLRRRRGR